MENNLVSNLKKDYVEQVETYNENLQDILKHGFGMSRDEVYEFLSKSEKQAHAYCIKELKVVFQQNANQHLLRKFNDSFKKDENGKRREWRDVEEAKIKEFFDESKRRVETLFEQFKRVFFPTGITQIEREKPGLNDSQKTFSIEDLANNPDLAKEEGQGSNADGMGFRRSRSSIAISSIRILTDEEVSRVKQKFDEETEFAYDEALRAHKNIQDTKVPVWLWLLLVWFASDNVAGYLTSPIFFYPMVLLAGIAVIMHQLGVLGLFIEMGLPMVKTQVNTLLARTPIPFRF